MLVTLPSAVTEDVFDAPSRRPDAQGAFKCPADGSKFMASFDIPQIPLSGPSDTRFNNPGKNPAINGVGWQNKASIDPEQIDTWAKQFPGCNFGSLAKHEVGKFFVLEADSALPLQEFKAAGGEDNFGSRLITKSSRGHHYWFRHNKESVDLLTNIGQGVGDFSLREHNEQCVSPGSVHSSGVQYTSIRGVSPAPASPKLLEWLSIQKKKNDAAPKKAEVKNGERVLIPEGFRYDACMKQAGRLWQEGFDPEDIPDMLVKWAHTNIAPPFSDDVIRGYARIKNAEQGCPAKDMVLKRDVGPAPDPNAPLTYVDGDMFMKEDIPPRKVLLRTITKKEPVFFQQSINQIYAWRGVGKTNLGLGLTRVFAAGGSFLNWEVPERVRVLYIEGEMPQSQLQERWKQIVGQTDGYARLITIDRQPSNMLPSLASAEGMTKVENTLAAFAAEGFKVDVLMLDSISTLFNVKANDEETWIAIQAWLMSLRSRGYCIFFFHHSGKMGLSRSHSKSEDMLDTSIKLDSPREKDPECLHAIMFYDKDRGGLSEPSTEIKMRRTHSDSCACKKSEGRLIGCRGDGVAWEHQKTTDALLERAFQMFSDGASLGDVSKELKTPRSTVQYWKNKWEKEGKPKAENDETADASPDATL
jgi:hypothetical protein